MTLTVSTVNGLVFHSANIGGMNACRFNYFLTQTRQNLDPDEDFIFIYDGAPAHRNPAIPAANTELEMLPAYSPFRNIVEQAISSLKVAIKGDVPRPKIQAPMDDRTQARCLGIPLGELRTRLLLDALQRCIGLITAAKGPGKRGHNCCGHIVADTNVSPFASAPNICCGHKIPRHKKMFLILFRNI